MKKTPLTAVGLYFEEKATPDWLKKYCEKVYELLKLQFFTVNIHYVSRKTANTRMKRLGYDTLLKTEIAGACIDPVYLTANLFFVKDHPAYPLNNDVDTRYIIFHEFMHIKLRYHTFDKVRLVLDTKVSDEPKLMRVEEETCEAFLGILDSLGAFQGALA